MNYKIFKTDLKPWLKKFFFEKFSYIIKTITGTIITITDGIRKKVNELKLSKLSTQETTTGKNKLNNYNLNYSHSNVASQYNILTTIDTGIRYNCTWNTGSPVVLFKMFDLTPYIGKTIRMKATFNNGGSIRIGRIKEDGQTVTGASETWTSGTTISINVPNYLGEYPYLFYSLRMNISTTNTVDFTDLIITIDDEDMTYEPYTGGQASPSPEFPQSVKTVKGYRNLFDKDNVTRIYGYITSNNWQYSATAYSFRITCQPNTNYVLSASNNSETIFRAGVTDSDSIPTSNDTITLYSVSNYGNTNTPIYITTGANAKYIVVQFSSSNATTSIQTLQLVEGDQELPYVPYGTNWVYTTITDGTNTKYVTLPLNNNEIAGIGDYKDEYIVDKNGHCWLNKKIEKIVLDGDTKKFITKSPYFTSDTKGFYQFSLPNKYIGNDGDTNNGKSNYFMFRSGSANAAFRNYSNGLWWEGNALNCYAILELTTLADANAWLVEHNTTIYYKLKESAFTLIDLNYNVDLTLYDGTNNISNSDDMDMSIKYYSK